MKTLNLILAAGQGKRMNSNLPKVLQPLGGRQMIRHLLDTVADVPNADTAIIYGHGGDQLQQAIKDDYPELIWIKQKEQKGTGDAVRAALDVIKNYDLVLILTGDTPLISLPTLLQLQSTVQDNGFALLTAHINNPFGYGRIIRNAAGSVTAIIEEKDADDEQQQICEVNTGIMALRRGLLTKYLPKLQNNNAQGEYYLTDLVALSHAAGQIIDAVPAENTSETIGINNRAQLAAAEHIFRQRQAENILAAGITLIDPMRIDIHGTVQAGRDVVIEPNVFLKGSIILGNNVYIESGTVLENCTIGDNVRICGQSRLENCSVGANSQVGPFARLRPKTVLCEGAKVGNFVEIKAATIGKGSKVNHLSYIGDASLGADVNIGAGTITCNYDGANKFQTILGDDVFIGSNSALVAPVEIGNGATIGAGSVISKDVAAGQLALTRAAMKKVDGWERPKKKK